MTNEKNEMTAKLLPTGEILTGKCRVSFPHLQEPSAFGTSAPKYGIVLLIPKTDPQAKIIHAAVKTEIDRMWPKGRPKGRFVVALRDGDDADADGVREEYAGHYFVVAKSSKKPMVVDRAKREITDEAKIYGGCYCRAVIKFAACSRDGIGVSAYLNVVQFVDDGEPFGGSARTGADALDDLDDLEPLPATDPVVTSGAGDDDDFVGQF